MPKTIEQLTEAKTGKVLQELRNLIINFEQNGYSMGVGGEAFLNYMYGLDLQKRKDSVSSKVMPCLQCGKPMNLYSVNTTPRNQVGGDYKSQWFCQFCGNSIYSVNLPKKEWKMLKENS